MADQPEGGSRRPSNESWPAPGDTQRMPPTAGEQPARPAPAAGEQPARPAPAAGFPVQQPYPVQPVVPYVGMPPPVGFGLRPQLEYSAVIALVLALLAWVACPVLAAIAALMIAGGAKAKIDLAGGALTGRGFVSAARWLAWIHLGLMLAGVIWLLVGFDLFGVPVR